MKKKSSIILGALPLLTLGLCSIPQLASANGAIGNEVALVSSMGSQQKANEIRGVVLDGKTSEPIIGASVVVKGATIGTTTNLDGEFTLKATKGNVLAISYLGYETKEISVTHWGIHHEIGHVMQMRPCLTWGGMTEVSNNLFSMYGTMSLGDSSRLSKRHIYEAAVSKVLNAPEKQFIMCVKDPFHKLIPFWQIQIYTEKVGYKDFYADLMEHLRNSPHKGTGNASIHNMYEYIQLCCDFLKTDLTEFFDVWGFFLTGQFHVGDYANYDFEVTPKMVEETKSYIASKKYPKPGMDLTKLSD